MKKKLNGNRGFIKVVLLVIAVLLLLKYAYDVDVLDKIYNLWLPIWSKYGHYLGEFWDWVKSFLN